MQVRYLPAQQLDGGWKLCGSIVWEATSQVALNLAQGRVCFEQCGYWTSINGERMVFDALRGQTTAHIIADLEPCLDCEVVNKHECLELVA